VLIGLTAMAANGTPMREVLGGYASRRSGSCSSRC
jgi:hypothetical protein